MPAIDTKTAAHTAPVTRLAGPLVLLGSEAFLGRPGAAGWASWLSPAGRSRRTSAASAPVTPAAPRVIGPRGRLGLRLGSWLASQPRVKTLAKATTGLGRTARPDRSALKPVSRLLPTPILGPAAGPEWVTASRRRERADPA